MTWNLGDLNPRFSDTDFGFDCPRCGKPYRIIVSARFRQPPHDHTWCWDGDLENIPTPGGPWASITVTPSIHNHKHGRTKVCGFHCTITKGVVSES